MMEHQRESSASVQPHREAGESEPISDERADAIHSMPWVRDCLLRYVDRPCDKEARDVVRAITNAHCGLMVGAQPYLSAPVPADGGIPAGYNLVPLEPTREMLERALYANERGDIEIREARAIYAAMLAAAPSVPLPVALPPDVTAWRDAYSEYVAAVDAYNTRLAAIRAREAQFPHEFGRDNPGAEFHAYTNAQNKAHRLIPAMHKALLSLPVADCRVEAGEKWMPIETAPKDGTFALLWLRAPYSVADVLRWEASVQGWVSAHWEPQDEGFCGSLVPSHWQPITPPSALSQPSAGTAGGATSPSSAIRDAAYDQIDRFLRNNLDDEDYADYSQALDLIYVASSPCAEGERGTANQEGGNDA